MQLQAQAQEKKELILAQLTFDQKLSEQTEKVDALQEKVDQKSQKVKELKLELEALKEAQNDKDSNQARMREEIDSNQKAKSEAETRAKKFESKFRQALKEIEELREQLEQAQLQQNSLRNEDDAMNTSGVSSLYNSNHNATYGNSLALQQ